MRLTVNDRAQFNEWVKANTGNIFSPGAQSSEFYYSIWVAGLRAGMERAAKICETLDGCADRGEYCAQEIRQAMEE